MLLNADVIYMVRGGIIILALVIFIVMTSLCIIIVTNSGDFSSSDGMVDGSIKRLGCIVCPRFLSLGGCVYCAYIGMSKAIRPITLHVLIRWSPSYQTNHSTYNQTKHHYFGVIGRMWRLKFTKVYVFARSKSN